MDQFYYISKKKKIKKIEKLFGDVQEMYTTMGYTLTDKIDKNDLKVWSAAYEGPMIIKATPDKVHRFVVTVYKISERDSFLLHLIKKLINRVLSPKL